jgi:NitT/TauT family transport system substrate-binding protein
MITRRPLRLTGLLVCAVALSVAIQSAAADAKKVTLRLDWKAYGAHAPFAWAVDRGLYRDEGLEVELLEGTGSGTGVKLIANGSDTFGLIDYSIVAIGVDKGMPVKGIFGVMQKGTLAVITTEEAGIRSPKDLAGKRLASSMSGSGATMFPAFLTVNGLKPDDVAQVRVEGPAKAQAVAAKRVDGQIGFGILEAPSMETLGVKPVVLNFADWGVPLMGLGLVANITTISEQPDVVRRFVRASARAWNHGLLHPKEVVAVLVRRYPLLKEETALRQFELTVPLTSTAATRGKPLGWMASSDWDAMQRLLRETGQVEKVRSAEAYFTNEFVPAP